MSTRHAAAIAAAYKQAVSIKLMSMAENVNYKNHVLRNVALQPCQQSSQSDSEVAKEASINAADKDIAEE